MAGWIAQSHHWQWDDNNLKITTLQIQLPIYKTLIGLFNRFDLSWMADTSFYMDLRIYPKVRSTWVSGESYFLSTNSFFDNEISKYFVYLLWFWFCCWIDVAFCSFRFQTTFLTSCLNTGFSLSFYIFVQKILIKNFGLWKILKYWEIPMNIMF